MISYLKKENKYVISFNKQFQRLSIIFWRSVYLANISLALEYFYQIIDISTASNVSRWKYLKSFSHDVIIFGHWTSVLYSKTKHTFKSDNEVYVTQFILRILCHKIVHALLNLTERDRNLKFLHSNIMSHHNDQLYSNYTGCMKSNNLIQVLEFNLFGNIPRKKLSEFRPIFFFLFILE